MARAEASPDSERKLKGPNSFSTRSEGVTSDDISRKILEAVPKDEKLR